MALLYCDSFDHYVTADIALKYPVHTIGAAADGPNIATGRFGNGMQMTYSNVTPGATTSVRRTIDGLSATTVIVGFAYFWTTQTTNDVTIVGLYEGTTQQITIRQNSSSQLYVARGSSAVATMTTSLSTNVWYYVEVRAFMNDSTGTVDLHVNGSSRATFTGDTLNGGTGAVTTLQLGPAPSTSIPGTLNYRIDDVYVCDTAGSAPNNTFLGDIRVEALFPNANGNSSQWVGSDSNSTDNYLLVDETAPNGADYVQSSTVGDKDTYNYTSITPLVGTIHGAQIVPYAAKTDAGTRTIVNVARSGSSESDSSSRTLSTTALYYPSITSLNPATGLAWTVSEINAAEFGVKVNT